MPKKITIVTLTVKNKRNCLVYKKIVDLILYYFIFLIAFVFY